MKKIWKRVVATALTVSLISSFNISKITFAEEKSTNEIAIDASNFPDSIFQDYVKSNFDANKDGKLNDEEISKITYIYVNMKGIKDLKGIENFTNLECLYAEMNYIESLDLSQNKNLVVGYFNNNLIKSVKLPNDASNNKLEVLSLFDNRLTEINLRNLDVLRYINLGDNRLTTLDLNVGKIESFTASYNELTEVKLPNSGATYYWKDLLKDQLYHERTGYDYKWYYDANKTQEVDPNVTPSIKLQGQTLYSEYIPIKYTVEFKAGDSNSESKVQNFVYDTPQNLLKNEFTKEEHTFSGWKDNSNGKIYSDEAEVKNLTTKNGDKIILSATWTEKDYSGEKYKINLYNEGSIVDTTEINYGTSFKPSTEKISKEGYTFLGWSIGNDEKVAYSNGEEIIMRTPSQLNGDEVNGIKSLNLYAVWKIKEFNVTFIDGENTYKKVVEYNKQAIAPADPTKKGYIFEGWLNEEGEVWNKDSLVTADMKLYAKYSPITYSVSFDGNGANDSNAMNNKTINMDYSKQAVLPTNLYEKTGYNFKGWSTSKNGEVEFADKDVIYQLTTENNKNITLYAVWEKIKEESEINITTDSLDKVYDGNTVSNPEVDTIGSNGEVKFAWYQKLNEEWEILESAPANVGIYKVVATVEEDETHKEASAEKEFKITKAENYWKTKPSINGWKANQAASKPMGEANFGEVVFTYSSSNDDGFTTKVPTEAGTWYMKATVEGNENYGGLESEAIEFTIEESENQAGDEEASDDENLEDKVVVDDIVISNGNSETNKFTYGDKIVIKFTINDKTRATKKVALFANDVQVTEAQDAIIGKELTFVYDTTNGLVNATGEISLKLAYVEGDVIGKEIYNSTITLDKKTLASEDIKVPEINENINLDDLQIKDGDIELKQGIDYDITKTQKGDIVTVVITFKGNYSGSITKTYKVELKEDETTKPDEVIDNNDNDDNNTVIITPDNEDITDDKGNKEENETLPNTGAVVSNNIILALALGIIAIGVVMFTKKRKHV